MRQNSRLTEADLPLSHAEIIKDYETAYISRQASLTGRREVLGGKAKFGIFGDGKEVAQVAMARAFRPGDWRSGYYRDQTFMMALGDYSLGHFFAQLYAHGSLSHEPASGGRQMNSHFATRFLDDHENWLDQTTVFNSSADLSPTGGQMARLVGLAYASRLYRESPALKKWQGAGKFSRDGNEVAFGTIGNASTSEGVFWESMNAAGVLQIPLLLSVWDDDYGISVPSRFQTTKESISVLMQGFAREKGLPGFELFQVCGYDYGQLVTAYLKAAEICRTGHVPVLIHVTEMTQPQGHSTSGSHERYKSRERLELEQQRDCISNMRQWLVDQRIATEPELKELESEAAQLVESSRACAWDDFQKSLCHDREQAVRILDSLKGSTEGAGLEGLIQELKKSPTVLRRQIQSVLRRAWLIPGVQDSEKSEELAAWYREYQRESERIYSSCLYAEKRSPVNTQVIRAEYGQESTRMDGRQIIQKYFENVLERDPRIFIIGEDVGQLGGVNLEFEGLQEKYGEARVTDTGIREATILGQGMGAALRGLRPVADIQYLDYLVYALQGMTDDLATVRYRTANGQACPLIVRTKGHRLEGIWHTGSPMGMLIHSLRGIHICVPRNGVQAAGMYETLLKGDDPGLVIEVLNGYRVKEICPSNLGRFNVPLGVPEVLKEGEDLTIVTYGANVRLALSVLPQLEQLGVRAEVIDVQTLLPFDLPGLIGRSVEKTNAVLFFDEDVPGGAAAYMMQEVLEKQGAYEYLDAPPRTLSAREHRSAYGSDGDYFSKPNADDLVAVILDMMHERYPKNYPLPL